MRIITRTENVCYARKTSSCWCSFSGNKNIMGNTKIKVQGEMQRFGIPLQALTIFGFVVVVVAVDYSRYHSNWEPSLVLLLHYVMWQIAHRLLLHRIEKHRLTPRPPTGPVVQLMLGQIHHNHIGRRTMEFHDEKTLRQQKEPEKSFLTWQRVVALVILKKIKPNK